MLNWTEILHSVSVVLVGGHTPFTRRISKDIGFALLLQLLLPQVVSLQLVLDDVHAQSSDLIVRDQTVELGEAWGETQSRR